MTAYSNDEFLKEVLGGDWAVRGVTFAPAAAYYSLRSAWLFPAVFLARGGGSAGRLVAAGAAIAVVAALTPGAMVADQSRVMALAWPAVLVAAEVAHRDMTADAFRQLAAAAAALNLLTPFYDVYSNAAGFVLRPPLPAALPYLLLPG